MNLIDKVILEWSYKAKKGYPDINSQEDLALFESMFGFNLTENSIQVQARSKIISDNPGMFAVQSKPGRIMNVNKISAQEFVDILKTTFDIENVKVHGPNTGPNKKSLTSKASATFDMFEFEFEDKQVLLLLVGGASANKGQQFEDRMFTELRDAAGIDITDLESPQVVQLLNFLKIDPKSYSQADVNQTGGKDTKRPLNLDIGAEDKGSTISDVEIKTPGKMHYLSIKNKKGDNIYNGGNVSAIRFNEDKTKIILDQDLFNADKTKVSIFDMFSIDPQKVVIGLNNYINQTGEDLGLQSVDFDKDRVFKMIGSAVDYGYTYVREATDTTLKIIQLNTAEDAGKFTGIPKAVKIRYPNRATKSTNIAVELEGSRAGYSKVLIEIRNAAGGLDKPSIKAKIL